MACVDFHSQLPMTSETEMRGNVVLAMAQIGVPSLAWREVFACVGAFFIGGTAWTRLAVFTEPRPVEPGRAVGDSPQPVLAAAAREG